MSSWPMRLLVSYRNSWADGSSDKNERRLGLRPDGRSPQAIAAVVGDGFSVKGARL